MSTDPSELSKFEANAADWWDTAGPMAPLHRFNAARIAFIRDAASTLAASVNAGERQPLRGLRILDVGCGGGLLAEPLARLGAEVVGIDPVDSAIEVARAHSDGLGLNLNYRVTTAEILCTEINSEAGCFDMVLASEVVEHVMDPGAFIATLAQLVRTDGGLCLSTLNRTRRAYWEAIIGAEYVLGWLPRGTHDWNRFMKPSELARALRLVGFEVRQLEGIRYDMSRRAFVRSPVVDTNYILFAKLASDTPGD